jgi:hypothetical protein
VRQSFLPFFAVSTVLLLQACAKPPVVVPPQFEPQDEAGHAVDCKVTPNPVVLGNVTSVHVDMVVGNDGGWCAVRMPQIKTALLRVAPEHGAPYFRNVRDITRLQYTPAAGYAGQDHFTFEILPNGVKIETTVTVKAPITASAKPDGKPVISADHS